VLGIINPDNFLGGRKKLHKELAAEAIRRHVADPLGLTVDEGAAAIYAIQNAQTADLVRKVVVNSGYDPRDFAVYSFGGAGPVHCASYSADLGVSEVVVPLGSTAAVFSAYGLAASDIVLTSETSAPDNFPMPAARVNELFGQLEDELQQRIADQGLEFTEIRFEREADIRYTMQLAEVSTPVPSGRLDDGAVRLVGAKFEELYERLYGKGTGFADAGLQVITYRVRAIGCLPTRPTLPELTRERREPQPRGTRQVFLDVRHRWQDTRIYDYRDLSTGAVIDGPAVVEAPTTTVAIPQGCTGKVDRLGNIVLRYTAMSAALAA